MPASVTYSFSAGTTIESGKVNQNFTDLVGYINGTSVASTATGITDAQLASPNNSVYRNLPLAGWFAYSNSLSAGTYLLGADNTGAAATLAHDYPVLYLASADYSVGSKTTKLRVRASALVNATGPATTFTVGLYEVTAVAGGSGVLNATLGTVISGSTVAFASPVASSRNQNNSGDFTIPADGHYVLAVVLAGTPAASSLTHIAAQLQIRHT